jgi:Rps23 Pro-64 3,4-dihydroxylase Tpa1-like proline 4-hydroxylase
MQTSDGDDFANLIATRLGASAKALSRQFLQSFEEIGVRYFVVDDLLPNDVAKRISEVFPDTGSMRLMSSFRERKFTSKSFDDFHPLMRDITYAIQASPVLKMIENITGIKGQIADPSLYAGGLSAMTRGHFLGPHIDNSHDSSRTLYRTLNVLYYVSPDWSLENGGNLELWDKSVRHSATIISQFNRLVVMETTPTSWHSVSRVITADIRRCVSNYYFATDSPTGEDYFNVTSFSSWPDQPFHRLLAGADRRVRQLIRRFVPAGFGKKDVYRGEDL